MRTTISKAQGSVPLHPFCARTQSSPRAYENGSISPRMASKVLSRFASTACSILIALFCPQGHSADSRSHTFASSIGWYSPLRDPTEQNNTVQVTTNFEAYSLGCTANLPTQPTDTYKWYWGKTPAASSKRIHLGVDLDTTSLDQPVYAIGDGRVTGVIEFSPGKAVLVEHRTRSSGGNFTVAYGHIKPANRTGDTREWQAGDRVLKGGLLGTAVDIPNTKGEYGDAGGDHLHFGLRRGLVESGFSGFINADEKTEDDEFIRCSLPAEVRKGNYEDPLEFLSSDAGKDDARLEGAIVGWGSNNPGGHRTSWRMEKDRNFGTGQVMRYWIDSIPTYWCLVERGAVDWMGMPANFFERMPDDTCPDGDNAAKCRAKHWATCP